LKPINKYTLSFFLALSCLFTVAQDSFFLNKNVSEKIDFEFTSNLIIIPLTINGVTLSFILDTGVVRPILFNLSERDSLDLKNTETFYLYGLGSEGKLKALKSSHNTIKVGGAVSTNKELYVIFDNTINFTPRLGVLVHGIIGYDIFKDFVVEINYNSKFIRLHNPNSFKTKSLKKWKTIPINLNKQKPYVDAKVVMDTVETDVKLLIDTGSSDSLWLFEDKEDGLIPNKDLFFVDYLGKGLSGSVYGKRSKTNSFILSDFRLSNVNVAFPDTVSITTAKEYKERNGSLGGEILKRFNIFFDYSYKKIHLKKNSYFKDPFTYNNSGVILEHHGTKFVREQISVPPSSGYDTKNKYDAIQINYSLNYIMTLKPTYKIVEVRKSSNAYASGLREDDILIIINGKQAYNFKLPHINKFLHGKTGKTIRLKVERNGESLFFKFKLDDAFKKNEPSN